MPGVGALTINRSRDSRWRCGYRGVGVGGGGGKAEGRQEELKDGSERSMQGGGDVEGFGGGWELSCGGRGWRNWVGVSEEGGKWS